MQLVRATLLAWQCTAFLQEGASACIRLLQLRAFGLQIACVCLKFREAARLALSACLNAFWYLEGLQNLNARLDSKLLLDWAPSCVREVNINASSCCASGLLPFIQACPQLRVLDIPIPHSWLALAQADRVLASCQNLNILKTSGCLFPNVMPATLTAVRMYDTDLHYSAGQGSAPTQLAEAMLYRLAQVPSLEKLDLDVGWDPVMAAQPEFMVHSLKHVMLSFKLRSTDLDLSWLRHQPFDELDLKIEVYAPNVAKNQHLVSQLAQLTVHRLTIALCCTIEASAQQLWASLVIQTHVNVSLCRGQTLAALPQCKSRHVGIFGYRDPGADFSILWAALISCPGQVWVQGYSCSQIQLIGCTGSAPDGKPWQLQLDQSTPVVGLTAPCTPAGRHRCVKNHAARFVHWPSVQSVAFPAHGWL